MSTTLDATAESSPAPGPEELFYKDAGATADPPPAHSETPADEAGAVTTEAEPEPAETDTEHEPEDHGKKSPRLSFRELRTAKERAEAKAELLERQLAAERERKAEPLPAPEAAVEPGEEEPDAADYADLASYKTALGKWIRAGVERELQAKQHETRQTEIEAGWNKREQVVLAKHPGYPQAFESFVSVAKMNPVLAAAAFESEHGPDLAHYLGTDRNELIRVASITNPALMKIALDDIAAKFSKGPRSGNSITNAPRPLATVGGTAGSAGKELSIEEVFYGKN